MASRHIVERTLVRQETYDDNFVGMKKIRKRKNRSRGLFYCIFLFIFSSFPPPPVNTRAYICIDKSGTYHCNTRAPRQKEK